MQSSECLQGHQSIESNVSFIAGELVLLLLMMMALVLILLLVLVLLLVG